MVIKGHHCPYPASWPLILSSDFTGMTKSEHGSLRALPWNSSGED